MLFGAQPGPLTTLSLQLERGTCPPRSVERRSCRGPLRRRCRNQESRGCRCASLGCCRPWRRCVRSRGVGYRSTIVRMDSDSNLQETYEDGFCTSRLHLVSELLSVVGGICRRNNAIEVVDCIGGSHVINLSELVSSCSRTRHFLKARTVASLRTFKSILRCVNH